MSSFNMGAKYLIRQPSVIELFNMPKLNIITCQEQYISFIIITSRRQYFYIATLNFASNSNIYTL